MAKKIENSLTSSPLYTNLPITSTYVISSSSFCFYTCKETRSWTIHKNLWCIFIARFLFLFPCPFYAHTPNKLFSNGIICKRTTFFHLLNLFPLVAEFFHLKFVKFSHCTILSIWRQHRGRKFIRRSNFRSIRNNCVICQFCTDN